MRDYLEPGEFQKLRITVLEEYWRESRGYDEKAIGQVILISSGAIIISINILNPLVSLCKELELIGLLFVSWVCFGVAVLTGVVYRSRLGRSTRDLAVKISQYSDPNRPDASLDWLRHEMIKAFSSVELDDFQADIKTALKTPRWLRAIKNIIRRIRRHRTIYTMNTSLVLGGVFLLIFIGANLWQNGNYSKNSDQLPVASEVHVESIE
jgi:hypothetical protein